ncbi:MAG: acyltransferase family protein [Marinicellaceae bacterium]
MEFSQRRYDIDWLRVIAIALLLFYHTAIGFQSWGLMIGFITNKEPWTGLWTPMTLLNVWRIPLLFFVSGMGVYFAIQKRNWKQLLQERTKRILLPFVFGMVAIVPIHWLILQSYYEWELSYKAHPSHLWFLGNIFIYTILLMPVFILFKKHKNSHFLIKLKAFLAHPSSILLVILLFVAEAMIIKPYPFELYAMTIHGFVIGLLAFLCGFLFMYSGTPFWEMINKWKWLFALSALALYIFRTHQGQVQIPLYRLSIESTLWIYTVFAFGYKYLNNNSKVLIYLSQSAYPIYIIHMIFLYLASYLIFPLAIDVKIKYFLVMASLFVGSFTFYEFCIKRINFIRPLFGLNKLKNDNLV